MGVRVPPLASGIKGLPAMQIAVEKKEGAELSFKVELPKERVEEELSRAFHRLVREVKVPGFRKGKVPRKIFEHRFGQEVLQKEAIKRLYPEVYQEVVVQQNLSPIIEPTLESSSKSMGRSRCFSGITPPEGPPVWTALNFFPSGMPPPIS